MVTVHDKVTCIYSDLVPSDPSLAQTHLQLTSAFAQDERADLQRQLADLKRRRELELRISALFSRGSIPVSELERSYAGLLNALGELERHQLPVGFS